MSKYDNYIFLSICETSIDFYKPTNFTTYSEFCKGMSKTLKLRNPNPREQYMIFQIIYMLDKVFFLSDKITGEYIADYFNLPTDKHADFQRVITDTNKLFPNYINKEKH